MSKLVFGLTSGFVPWCGRGGTWKQVLPKILDTFENSVLISAANSTYILAEVLYEAVGKERLFLDSGGYTLFRKQSQLGEEDFAKLCEKMRRKFLKMLSIAEYRMIFELDNEYFRKDEDLMSPKNYCRQDVFDAIGEYPTPVFKMHQGFKYWKDLCESELYPTLAIGGLAPTRSWHVYREELVKMLNYARQNGKKVHLLGCQNVETFKLVKPDSVDYCIAQYAINFAHARREYPDMDPNDQVFLRCMAMHAFAKAKSRSFLYDSLEDDGSEDE